jgi:transcriptional repressor NrdR
VDSDKVVDSRTSVDGDAIRRRRECLACGRRFTTYERLEPIPLTVRKRSGATEPFDRDKLARGLSQAVAGRAVAAEAVEALVADLAAWAESQAPEIASDAIGVAVLERLRTLDPVSYLRFASVYKGFEDLADFEAEVSELQRRAGDLVEAPDLATTPLQKTTAPKTPEPERR